MKGNERALDKILDRAGSATSLGNPGEGEPAGHRAEAPHGHGVAAKVLEGAGVGYGVGRAEKEAHKILHLHHGRLVANPVSLGVGGAAVLLDVGLRWIEHHRIDQTSYFFLGARAAVAVLGGAGAMPSGGLGVVAAVVAEAVLNWIESSLRGAELEELKAKLESYQEWAKGRVKLDSESFGISQRWRFEHYTRPSSHDLRGNPMQKNPARSYSLCH